MRSAMRLSPLKSSSHLNGISRSHWPWSKALLLLTFLCTVFKLRGMELYMADFTPLLCPGTFSRDTGSCRGQWRIAQGVHIWYSYWTLLRKPASHIRVPCVSPSSTLHCRFLLVQSLEGSRWLLQYVGPCTHMGGLGGVPGSWCLSGLEEESQQKGNLFGYMILPLK